MTFIEETFDISNYFNYKNRQKTINRYNVVYKIKYNSGKNNTGQTKRNLATRFKDHNPNSTNQETHVTKHISDNFKHYNDFNNIIVSLIANHWRKIFIKKKFSHSKT